MEALAHDCKNYFFTSDDFNSGLKSHEIWSVLNEINVPMNEVIQNCKWRGENCKKYFVPMVTFEGFCYTFNTLNSSEMFKDV